MPFEWNAELEDAIRDDPDDDARWSVLEDWILERDDARAEHVRLAKAGDHDAALRVTWEIAKDLLEIDTKQFGALYAATAGCEWRAGYIVHGYFEAPSSTRMALLEVFLGRRAASLMRQLRISIDSPADLAALPGLLARAPCSKTLRRLIVAAYWKPAANPVFHATASLALDELRLYSRAIRIAYGPPIERLRRLATTPGAAADLIDLFAPGRFASLEHLELDLVTLEARGWRELDVLAPIYELPKLQRLSVKASDAVFAAIATRAPSTLDMQRA